MVFGRRPGHVGLGAQKLDAQIFRALRDKALVFVRFVSPQMMVEMDRRERQAGARRKFGQEIEQQDRVRPAGHGHAHAFAGAEGPPLAHSVRPAAVKLRVTGHHDPRRSF